MQFSHPATISAHIILEPITASFSSFLHFPRIYKRWYSFVISLSTLSLPGCSVTRLRLRKHKFLTFFFLHFFQHNSSTKHSPEPPSCGNSVIILNYECPKVDNFSSQNTYHRMKTFPYFFCNVFA